MNYRLAYSVGFHPWEDAATDQPFVEKIGEVLDREANGGPPHGRALDLGTGSGIWGIELARRGWEVTGVNHVEKAQRRARERISEAGVKKQLLRGDVTPLREAGVGSGYRLLLDTGTSIWHIATTAWRASSGEMPCPVRAHRPWPRSCSARGGCRRPCRRKGTCGHFDRHGAGQRRQGIPYLLGGARVNGQVLSEMSVGSGV